MLDSIDSTELGRFPDDDVADSLAHLPGITLERTTGGEGQKISVRGLTSEYNIVTLNNRILASDDDGRDLAFDVLPAELITGADVLKSPQASAVEGSIGGTVNLHTASAFDNPGFHAGAHGEGNYNDMSHLKGSKYSGSSSRTPSPTIPSDSCSAGCTRTLNIRTDSLNAYNQNIYGPTTYPYPPADAAPVAPLVATPCCITFGSIFDDKKRDASDRQSRVAAERHLPPDADGLWTHLNDPQIGYNESYYFAANPDGTPWETNAVVQERRHHRGDSRHNSSRRWSTTPSTARSTRSSTGSTRSWQPTDSLTFGFDAYRSTASRPEGGQDSFVTAGLVNDSPSRRGHPQFQLTMPNSLPNINVVCRRASSACRPARPARPARPMLATAPIRR